MLKLFKRSSKSVNERENDRTAAGDHSSSSVNPTDKRELLTRYVGKGKSDEPLNELYDRSNVGKYCRVTVQENCLIVTELTDVEVVRILGDQISQCLQPDGSNKRLCHCVGIVVGKVEGPTGICHLFETCSVKEVIILIAPPI